MIEDEIIRENILTFLHEAHQQTKSIKKIALGIRDIQSGLKKRFSYSQQQVAHNLDYLIQIGWVVKETVAKEFTTRAGVKVPQETTKYKISSSGIDYMQGPSKFEKSNFSNIKVKNINGVVAIGNHNIVNASFTNLDQELEVLQRKLSESKKIDDSQKLNAQADIATIRSQLSKPEPDKSIIRSAWSAVERIAAVAGFIDFCQKIQSVLPL